MEIFSAGTEVTLSVPLTDKSGNPLTVSAISYRVTDEAGNEIVSSTLLSPFTSGAEEAVIVVPAANNTLGAGIVSALRNIEINATVGSNVVHLHSAYAIETADPLVVGVNSFQSYPQAEFTALSMAYLKGWNAADPRDRIVALIDARAHIVQLSFRAIGGYYDRMNSIEPEYESGLESYTPAQFATLPEEFIEALKKAQVAEADYILGGDGIEQKRQDGLIQDNIGESRQMFRQSKPLQLPVCRRALNYLSRFVTFSKRVGRN